MQRLSPGPACPVPGSQPAGPILERHPHTLHSPGQAPPDTPLHPEPSLLRPSPHSRGVDAPEAPRFPYPHTPSSHCLCPHLHTLPVSGLNRLPRDPYGPHPDPGPRKVPGSPGPAPPPPHTPLPLPKLGGLLRGAAGDRTGRGLTHAPLPPYAAPLARGPGTPWPLHDCSPVLLLACFFFCKLCPRPAPRLTRRCDLPSGLGGRPVARRLCIRSAPGRSELRTPSPTGGRGGWRGLRSPVTPSSSQTAASAPSRPRGRGPGAMGALRHPWRTLISRNRGSGIGTEIGSRRRRGRGRGVGRRGGERSRRRLPAVPAAAALPPPRPLSAAPLFPEPSLLPPAPPGACGPERAWRRGHHPPPRPPTEAWGLLDSWLCPACSPSWGALLDPLPETDPEPRGMAAFNALGPPSGYTKPSGIWDLERLILPHHTHPSTPPHHPPPPPAWRRQSHPRW